MKTSRSIVCQTNMHLIMRIENVLNFVVNWFTFITNGFLSFFIVKMENVGLSVYFQWTLWKLSRPLIYLMTAGFSCSHRHFFHSKNICPLLFLTSSALFPFPISPQYFSLICDPFADPIQYIVTLPRYFSFRLPHLNMTTGPPQTNWTRIFSERRLVYFSVIEMDTATSGLLWIFHMHSEFSRPAMCINAITLISPQM